MQDSAVATVSLLSRRVLSNVAACFTFSPLNMVGHSHETHEPGELDSDAAELAQYDQQACHDERQECCEHVVQHHAEAAFYFPVHPRNGPGLKHIEKAEHGEAHNVGFQRREEERQQEPLPRHFVDHHFLGILGLRVFKVGYRGRPPDEKRDKAGQQQRVLTPQAMDDIGNRQRRERPRRARSLGRQAGAEPCADELGGMGKWQRGLGHVAIIVMA